MKDRPALLSTITNNGEINTLAGKHKGLTVLLSMITNNGKINTVAGKHEGSWEKKGRLGLS